MKWMAEFSMSFWCGKCSSVVVLKLPWPQFCSILFGLSIKYVLLYLISLYKNICNIQRPACECSLHTKVNFLVKYKLGAYMILTYRHTYIYIEVAIFGPVLVPRV